MQAGAFGSGVAVVQTIASGCGVAVSISGTNGADTLDYSFGLAEENGEIVGRAGMVVVTNASGTCHHLFELEDVRWWP